LFTVTGEIRFDKEAIRDVAFGIRDTLLQKGYSAGRVTIPTPGKHPNGDQMNALLFLFQLFGGLSLALSGVLVINMISSMLSGQVRQIGVMKAVGARRGQIASLYCAAVLLSGGMALALAMPAAAALSKALLGVCASMLNFSVAEDRIPLWPFAVQLAAGLLAPMLAATYPILKGTGITVREALRDYGTVRQRFGSARNQYRQWPGRLQGARPLLLSIRNTFRRKGRLLLTVTTLAVGGAILIAALNVSASLDNTVNQAMTSLGYDLQFFLSKAYPQPEVASALQGIPGLEGIETLSGAMSSLVYRDGTESNAFQLAGIPPDMQTLRLPMLEGRWIQPGDTTAIVLNHTFLDSEPQLKVGDQITLKSEGQVVDWVIAGIAKEVGSAPKAYVNVSHYQEVFDQAGTVRVANLITRGHSAADHEEASARIEKALQDSRIGVMLSNSFTDTREVFDNHLALIAGFLIAASVLVILVGVMGLVSAMSMNVMERMREIGIMRSYGAASKDILHIVIGEGMLIGAISFAASLLLSIPLSFAVGDLFGGIFLQTPLDNVLSPSGYALWLGIVMAVTILAGFGVTLKALETPVNEVLNYE
jgi:putative ABC transport system permease protein